MYETNYLKAIQYGVCLSSQYACTKDKSASIFLRTARWSYCLVSRTNHGLLETVKFGHPMDQLGLDLGHYWVCSLDALAQRLDRRRDNLSYFCQTLKFQALIMKLSFVFSVHLKALFLLLLENADPVTEFVSLSLEGGELGASWLGRIFQNIKVLPQFFHLFPQVSDLLFILLVQIGRHLFFYFQSEIELWNSWLKMNIDR